MVTKIEAPSTLDVCLHGNNAGKLRYDGSIYSFQYNDSYLKSKDAIPISLSLPLKEGLKKGSLGGKNVPPYFYHLLPEGWLLNLAKTMQFPVNHPMDLLSLLVVETIGAIRILNEGEEYLQSSFKLDMSNEPLILEADPSGPAPFAVKHNQCLYCGKILVNPGINDNYHPNCSMELFGSKKTPRFNIDREKIREIASRQLSKGESLTGVQEKFSLKHRNDRKTIAAPLSYFIAKPQPRAPELTELSNLEGAYMLYARMLGLPVAKSGVIYLADGTACFISRRFDISSDNKRIHQEDLAAPLERYNKYESSHEGIAKLLISNTTISEEVSRYDRASFLKITLFNFLLGNTDAHLKNFAIFHYLESSKPAYRLTPFYDIFPSLLYAPRDSDELGLNLHEKKRKLIRTDFESLARLLQLGPRTVSAFINNFKKSRATLIQALDAYRVTHPMQYRVLELAKNRLQQLEK